MATVFGPLILAHAVGSLPDHEELMLLWPVILLLLIITIVVVTMLEESGRLRGLDRLVEVNLSVAAVATAISLGAAAIHLSVIQSHLDEGLEFAAFFLVTGWFQMVWPIAYLLRRSRSVALVAIVVNLGIVGVWVVSRTVGMPFGPTPWVAQSIGFADILATAMELSLAGLLVLTVAARFADLARRPMSLKDVVILGSFAMLTVAVLTGYALITPTAAA